MGKIDKTNSCHFNNSINAKDMKKVNSADLYNKSVFIKPMYCYKQNHVETLEDVAKNTGLSEKYLNKLVEFEGFKLEAYKDVAGNKTIGIGHNIDADSTYSLGDTITKEQAYELLQKDLSKAKSDMELLTNKTSLNQGQKEALIDIFFNVGAEKLADTKLIQNVKEGKLKEVPKEMNFVLYKNEFSPALCQRRLENMKMFDEKNPNRETIFAMNSLLNKANSYYNKKAGEKAPFVSLITQANKYFFTKNSERIINEAKRNFYTSRKK